MKNFNIWVGLVALCGMVLEIGSRAEVKVQELSPAKTSLGEAVMELDRPQFENLKIVLWYFGRNGLRQEGVSLYRNDLFSKTTHLELQFFLYDLTAWAQLDGGNLNVFKNNAIAERIASGQSERYPVLFSSAFFVWLGGLSVEKMEYIHTEIATRSSPWKKSQIWQEESKGTDLTGIFKSAGSDKRWSSLLHKSTVQSYSFLQYLEGIYLVQQIASKFKKLERVQILFLLPNDELEYYRDSDSQYSDFVKDLNWFVALEEKESPKQEIQVYFQEFGFGNSKKDRPYLKGKVLKGKGIKVQELL